MNYDRAFFDAGIDRAGTQSVKWAARGIMQEGMVPLWVADMDFRAPACVLEALHARVEHGVFGYAVPPEGLMEAIGGMNRIVYSAQNAGNLPGQQVRVEGGPPTGDAAADEAYDGAGATHSLYKDVYNRDSIDGNGARLDSTVHYRVGYDNAFWNGQQMVYGDGDEDLAVAERLFNRFTIAIDIIGHELTHAVTQFTANLVYQGQSGALNESMSDVFGSLVKQRNLGQTAAEADWIIGEGLFTSRVNSLVDAAESRGMYAIVDFHTLTPGDPTYNLANAKTFFQNVATRNASKKNVIYEITNEPNGVSWSTIRAYANEVIPVIRAADPDAVIIVGTPGWSSLGVSGNGPASDVINNKLSFPNVMYAFHFYAASHGDNYRSVLQQTASQLPMFVTVNVPPWTSSGANVFDRAR